MSSKSGTRITRTVTFRLTLWYAALTAALVVAFLGIFFLFMTKNLGKRVDGDIRDEVRETETVYLSRGLEELRRHIDFETESEGKNRLFIRMLNPRGEVSVSSDMSTWGDIRLPSEVRDIPVGAEVMQTLSHTGRESKVRVITRKISGGNLIQIGYNLHDDERLARRYYKSSGILIVLLLGCVGVMGWFMARRAMSGVERVTHTAIGIGKTDLVSRVPMGDEGEEINNLARAFNDMLERIQGVIMELKEVTNNIAHDLRSPITRIRGIAETTMTGPLDMEEYREMAQIVVEECDRLVGMINVMLEIAVTEAGIHDMARSEVDMSRLVGGAGEVFRPIAEDKGLSLLVNLPGEPVFVQGDRHQLQRAISNLLDNAIKFTPHGGTVTLALDTNQAHAIIRVTDTGIGIPGKDLPRIFERFYRGDQSRSTPGNGLGLSHVQAIVHAHAGEIKVESAPGKGSTFIVSLPF
ncbi:MAG TPA: ATP-binding protein [Deltaproteobacteria bacterium]|nr:ATP-binding protein [Deltaproteobacteria bacterium]